MSLLLIFTMNECAREVKQRDMSINDPRDWVGWRRNIKEMCYNWIILNTNGMEKKCFASACHTNARTPSCEYNNLKLRCSLLSVFLLVALMGWHWPCFQHNFNTHFLFVLFPNSFSSSKCVCVCAMFMCILCVMCRIFFSPRVIIKCVMWFRFNGCHLIVFIWFNLVKYEWVLSVGWSVDHLLCVYVLLRVKNAFVVYVFVSWFNLRAWVACIRFFLFLRVKSFYTRNDGSDCFWCACSTGFFKATFKLNHLKSHRIFVNVHFFPLSMVVSLWSNEPNE